MYLYVHPVTTRQYDTVRTANIRLKAKTCSVSSQRKKETARCRRCSLRFNVRRHSLQVYKYRIQAPKARLQSYKHTGAKQFNVK